MYPIDCKISKLTGMFLDKTLERQFQESYLKRSKSLFRITVFIVGIFFFCFLLYDVWANLSISTIVVISLCRLLILILSLLIYFKTDVFLKTFTFLKITIYELLIVTIFFLIAFSYENPHFLIQAFALSIITLAILIVIPNLFHYKVILSSLSLISFLLISLVKYGPSGLELISVLIYVLLAIIFSSISTYSLGKYQRLDFANKLYLTELSIIDPLTNVYNRQKFNESLHNEIILARRYGNNFSIIMFDIDHFKAFNDTKGHIFGDKILIQLAHLVKASVREMDVLARWGGEEFVILLPHTKRNRASFLAERLRNIISQSSLENDLHLTCSFGVTSFLPHDDEDSIMNRVDSALYMAKDKGRNNVVAG